MKKHQNLLLCGLLLSLSFSMSSCNNINTNNVEATSMHLDDKGIMLGSLLPASSKTYSNDLALCSLQLCSGHTLENTNALFTSYNFDILLNKNYSKTSIDVSHTCAYTVAKKEVLFNSTNRNLVVIAIRGTADNEWYNNFDFAPSHNDNAVFSENFLYAANECLLSCKTVLDEVTNPLILLTGHSRGAACANLLGMYMNTIYGINNVYTYTFATPRTVKKDAVNIDCSNIFNIINPNDVVPLLPLSIWNYERLGTDIILDCSNNDYKQKLDKDIDSLGSISPSINKYYTEHHALDKAGLDENGLTIYDFMLMLASSLTSMQASLLSDNNQNSNSPNMEFLDYISEDSDLYPLIKIIKKVTNNNNEIGNKVLNEHLPTTYVNLINERKSK